LGGHEGLEKIVAQYYQFVLTDERINSFFLDNVSDISKLHSTFLQFLIALFGGPNNYKGLDMHALHKNMAIKKGDFDTNWEHLESSFLILKINRQTIS